MKHVSEWLQELCLTLSGDGLILELIGPAMLHG
jgi:hypothetical protein